MHISKLSLVNFRNFRNSKFIFDKGINTIIGENGAGKTNVFRAIRLLLDDSMPRYATKLKEADFYRGLGDWRGHWIVISIEFNEIAPDEASQSLFLHGLGNFDEDVVERATFSLIFRPKAYVRQELAKLDPGDQEGLDICLNKISIDDYETVLMGKGDADFNDDGTYESIVGDFENVIFPSVLNDPRIGAKLPNILNIPNEVSFTFIKALRDVVSDFRSNRTNPLLTLLKSKSGDISDEDFGPIKKMVGDLNAGIDGLADVREIRDDIVATVNDAVGDAYSPNSISIRSGLPDEADHLFQSLKLFVAEYNDDHEGTIQEMSLGGANLLYLTLKLLEFKYQTSKKAIANFLLIEEPESHIHTHVQKTLFERIKYEETQIIYSTHSSHISEVSNISKMNIIGFVNGGSEVFHPAAGLSDADIAFVQRYLDAIRSNLLFARSVILVEGDAEEILIPLLVKNVVGLSLDEMGISLVNIRSTGFKNISILFSDERLRKRCSIITDLDEAFFDIEVKPEDSESLKKEKNNAFGSQKSGKERQQALEDFCNGNPWVETFFADHTFEVDFIKSGNSTYMKKICDEVYSRDSTRDESKIELSSSDIAVSGRRALKMAKYQGKGWFALTLGKVVDFKVGIPRYISDAILFASGGFNEDIVYKIIKHRYESILSHIEYGRSIIDQCEFLGEKDRKEAWERYLIRYEQGVSRFSQKWESFDPNEGNVEELKNSMIFDIPAENQDVLRWI